MANKLVYTSHMGKTFNLDDPKGMLSGTAPELFSTEWTRELGTRDLRFSYRKARECKIEIGARDGSLIKAFLREAEYDTAILKPGMITCRGWTQRAYIVATEQITAYHGTVRIKATIALLDGVWFRYHEESFQPRQAIITGKWLDYSHEYSFDFAPGLPSQYVEFDTLNAPNIRLIIYGQVTNPYVIIGNNRYEVQCSVAQGSRLEIDGRYKTITLIDEQGHRQNMFDKGVRGQGQGGKKYIFERLPLGRALISWDNSFGFDLGWYEETEAPPWQG